MTQVLQIQLNNPFRLEDQRKFWKRLHRILSQNEGWWKSGQRRIWIDFVYRPRETVRVYFSIPRRNAESIISLLAPKGRRRSVLGNAACIEVDKKEIFVPKHSSICELKLAYEDLFSLSTIRPLQIPLEASLEEGEMARISFCLEPISPNWPSVGMRTIQDKIEKGLVHLKEHRRVGFFWFIFFLIRQLVRKDFVQEVMMEKSTSWLSAETLKKWNDCHFKTMIRISGPQRLLPKLSRPFQALQGENKLTIHFLSRSENQAGLREMNKQRLDIFHLRNSNPNILASREVIAIAPFLTFIPTKSQVQPRPNLL
ncbi:MAG TPA: hypothetical protein VJ824_06250 [Bacillota bacterium]|nr:hypothetical protein [Bacillota bacterium]